MYNEIYYEERSESLLKHYVGELSSGFNWKIIASILGSIIANVEGFYGAMLWGFLSLFTLDLITGIMKSKYKGVPITSRRLRDSVVKLGAYMVLITALIITSRYEDAFTPVITITYYYFMFTELKSILENAEEMGVKVPGIVRDKVNSKHQEYDNSKTK